MLNKKDAVDLTVERTEPEKKEIVAKQNLPMKSNDDFRKMFLKKN